MIFQMSHIWFFHRVPTEYKHLLELSCCDLIKSVYYVLNKVRQLDYPRDLSQQRPTTFNITSIIVIETYALGIDRNLKSTNTLKL